MWLTLERGQSLLVQSVFVLFLSVLAVVAEAATLPLPVRLFQAAAVVVVRLGLKLNFCQAI